MTPFQRLLADVEEAIAKCEAAQLGRLADRNATSTTQEANRAVRELLEREGLWPPPPDEASSKE